MHKFRFPTEISFEWPRYSPDDLEITRSVQELAKMNPVAALEHRRAISRRGHIGKPQKKNKRGKKK